MKIGLDVMGGDYAPQATIEGAILCFNELSDSERIVLIGDKNIIIKELEIKEFDPQSFDIIDARDVIGMGEHPIRSYSQKPNSSIAVGLRLLKEKQIDAFSSAGNSGAVLVASIYSVNTIQGIIRPCTSTVVPQEKGGVCILLDIGTNPDTKPDVMYQFAILGSLYVKYLYNIENPKIGLLNIGTEEEKGNLLCQATFQLMKGSKDFNFIGNVEGRDLFNEKADVIVCDGFTGNIVLKQTEAIYRLMVKRNLIDDYFSRFNYENHGGSPILGINSTVIIGHGISNKKAIKNMILLSKKIYQSNLSGKIHSAIEKYSQNNSK